MLPLELRELVQQVQMKLLGFFVLKNMTAAGVREMLAYKINIYAIGCDACGTVCLTLGIMF